MKNILIKLFCRHKYEQIAWYEEWDECRQERYSERLYRCTKCGKEILVDGRYDPYSKRS
jgi:DNA-directed RNA polymerase subunit RPC12/RpoP